MPTLDDLNEIKSNLLKIGDETGILAAKGETPVDIGPPETGLSDDLNALFDDFSDVEDEGTEAGEPETGEGKDIPSVPGLVERDDFDFDFEDDESVFDMDGFDAPEEEGTEAGVGGVEELAEFDESSEELFKESETDIEQVPDDLVPELVEGEDELLNGLFDEEDTTPDVAVPEPVEREELEPVPEFVEGDEEEDLGFADLVGADVSDELIPDVSDSELVEGDFDDGIDFDLEADSEPGGLPAAERGKESGDDFALADDLDAELGLDDELSDDLVPESVEGEPGDEEILEESMDFDLSGEEPDFGDVSGPDDFGLPGDEIDLGGEEELSLDDSDAGGLDLDEFEISDESLDEELEIDEFDLGDLGQDFGVLEEDISSIHEEEMVLDESSAVDLELEEEEFEITSESFDRVKATLLTLPWNLKLIIEEEIGEKGLKGPSLKKLIDALAEGKTPKEIAAITSKITGKKIKIPAYYAKKTGLDFEEEKGTFQYTLIHNILPLLKIFAISTVIIAALSFVGYKFIYRPVHASILYNRGWEQLEKGNYDSSSDLFDQAFDKYEMKKQFYRYAEGYVEANQWTFARRQYDKLLDNYHFDKKGTIDYATMEFEKLFDYEHSTGLLNDFLKGSEKHKRDYDALLLLGDIYLEWGWEDKARYDDARLAYAKIMSSYGVENEILFRMLKYFIRTDNAKEVNILKERFQADKELKIDPEAYAELAGYQIDRKDIDDAQELLFRAKEIEDGLPEIHYQLARLFNITGEGDEEDKALKRTLINLKNKQPLKRRYLEVNIDTLRRQGERFFIKREYLQAEEVYQAGIELLEKSRERNIIKGQGRDYGRLYADLGHIYYYISENPDIALDQYEKAEGEGFYSPEIYYNKGYIRYRSEDFRQALLEFYNSAGSFSVNSNLLYATANTLFHRNDYFAAQGYYNHLLDILEQKINREFTIRLEDREDHRMMVENLMKAYNNVGVTLYGLFERTGDPAKFTASMVSFTRSTGYFDDLTRDQETLERTETINLAALNQRKMLYPIPDYELQIFVDLPKHRAPR